MLFRETLAYQQEAADKLRLNVVRLRAPPRRSLAAEDPEGTLNQVDQDACCDLRKVRPLEAPAAGR